MCFHEDLVTAVLPEASCELGLAEGVVRALWDTGKDHVWQSSGNTCDFCWGRSYAAKSLQLLVAETLMQKLALGGRIQAC